MGILERFGLAPSASLLPDARAARTIASPWTESNLTKFIGSDIFASKNLPIDRATAMRVPSVVKARALIVGPLSRQPLTVLEGDTPIADQPSWCQRTVGVVSPQHRMAWTIDDLFFYGWALWAVTRAPGDSGEILDAQRVPFSRWRFNEAGAIETTLDGQTWTRATDDQVILIPGPQEGLLDIASDTLRGALDLDRAWVNRARNPIPLVEISQTDDVELEDDEVDDLLDGYVQARRADESQAVMFTPRGIELKTHGDSQVNLFVEGRNALRLDVAAFSALPGALLDASLSTASLTYSTSEGKRNELIDYSLGYWADPITGRFSQDDVVPEGQRTRFDMVEFTSTAALPTGPVTKD